jgi:hypothetical protein
MYATEIPTTKKDAPKWMIIPILVVFLCLLLLQNSFFENKRKQDTLTQLAVYAGVEAQKLKTATSIALGSFPREITVAIEDVVFLNDKIRTKKEFPTTKIVSWGKYGAVVPIAKDGRTLVMIRFEIPAFKVPTDSLHLLLIEGNEYQLVLEK